MWQGRRIAKDLDKKPIVKGKFEKKIAQMTDAEIDRLLEKKDG